MNPQKASPQQIITLLPPDSGKAALTTTERASLNVAVRDINAAYMNGNLETMRTVGALVVSQFFAGDTVAFQDQHKKHKTYRALASHPDLRVPATMLWYSVHVHTHFEAFGEQIARGLTLSHHRNLAHVRDIELRAKLADKAIEQDLTAEELQRLARANEPDRPVDAPRLGRPRTHEVTKGLAKASKALEALAITDNVNDVADLHAEDRAAAIEAAQRISDQALAIVARLRQ